MLAASRSHPDLVAQLVPAPYTLFVDRTIQRLVREKYLGEILALDVKWNSSSSFLDRASPMTWRQDITKSGVNVMSLGILYEAIMRWFGRATSVFAMGKVCVKERLQPETGKLEGVQIPDHLDVLAQLANGAQARMQFTSVLGPFATPSQEISLYGSEGTLHIDVKQQKLFGAKRGEATLSEIPIADSERQSWRVEEEFVAAIRGEAPVTLTRFEEGVDYMTFTQAVHDSMQQGKVIPL